MEPTTDPADREPAIGATHRDAIARHPFAAFAGWAARVDPGTHRRIKGLRLVTAYGLAAALGTLQDVTHGLPRDVSVGTLAAGFALWASVSEARTTRPESSRDLALLCAAAAFGAALYMCLAHPLLRLGHAGPELTLVTGAFLVGYLKRFGVLGAGLGSQIYIGQLMAYGAGLVIADLPAIAIAGLIAMLASIVPRLLSGPAERPAVVAALSPGPHVPARPSPEFVMGLQAAAGALVVVALNATTGIEESAWAITACTYVVAGSATGTVQRVRRRIIGTLVGVPLGLACLPVAEHAPLVIWLAAALAMIVYAMALPERYDIACGAFAFTLIVTLAVSGVHSIPFLAARAWETLIGGVLGLLAAMFIFPLKLRES
ncbi:FUSC family protein [Paraburkholderia azotifigens]|uniref:FUSC family protein n=1 Tax=Paraburkholderia azotifigens TaxID=2057004 RepID=A0A5C6VM56_9BURK|nr:FUSC family protein [Paraburkholderia azotifigens]TXC84238.1 FUSC family protein [Paraburkholderia azotifigens]